MLVVQLIPRCCSYLLLCVALTTPSALAQGADECAEATSTSAVGNFAYDGRNAKGSFPATACGVIYNDVWWCWTAPCDGEATIEADGWSEPAVAVYEELFARLGDDRLHRIKTILFHGMVRQRGAKLKSSSGDALLIDTFLDRVIASPEVQALVARGADSDNVVALVTMAFFLSRPVAKPIEFSWDSLPRRTTPSVAISKMPAPGRNPSLKSKLPVPTTMLLVILCPPPRIRQMPPRSLKDTSLVLRVSPVERTINTPMLLSVMVLPLM